MISQERQSEVNTALEQSGGDRALAAAALGLKTSEVNDIIHDIRWLRNKWTKDPSLNSVAPGIADAAHREVMELQPVVGGELVPDGVVEALRKEDKLLAKGLAGLGVSGELVELAVSFQKFAANHYSRTMEIMSGGLVRRFLKTEAEIDKLDAEIARLAMELASAGPEEMALFIREQTLRKDRVALMAIQSQVFDRTNKAALTQAIIKAKQAQANGTGPKAQGRPGFGPRARLTQINVAAGATVNTK